MAIIQDPMADEEKKEGAEDTSDIGALAQPAAAPGPQAGQGQAVTGQAKPTSSGSFTGLQKFVEANRPKIQRQGEQTTERLGGAVAGAQETYQDKATEASKGASEAILDTETYTKDKGLVDIAADDALDTTKKYMGGVYGGPTAKDFQTGSQEAWSGLQKADEALKATSTQAGLSKTLQQDKTGGYGQGLSRLNAALMGREKSAQAGLGAAREQYSGVEEAAGATREGVFSDIDAAKAANVEQGNAFKDWYAGKRSALEGDLTTAASDATTAAYAESKADAEARIRDELLTYGAGARSDIAKEQMALYNASGSAGINPMDPNYIPQVGQSIVDTRDIRLLSDYGDDDIATTNQAALDKMIADQVANPAHTGLKYGIGAGMDEATKSRADALNKLATQGVGTGIDYTTDQGAINPYTMNASASNMAALKKLVEDQYAAGIGGVGRQLEASRQDLILPTMSEEDMDAIGSGAAAITL